MLSDYFIYLNTLSHDERILQIMYILLFFIILFSVNALFEFIRKVVSNSRESKKITTVASKKN